jgi:phosphate transport system permease protein
MLRVVIPTALPGMITGSLLAVARAAGETAPLLFTATIVQDTSFNVNGAMNSMPVQIFSDVKSPSPVLVERAWGTALTLVLMILALTLIARLIQSRRRVEAAP